MHAVPLAPSLACIASFCTRAKSGRIDVVAVSVDFSLLFSSFPLPLPLDSCPATLLFSALSPRYNSNLTHTHTHTHPTHTKQQQVNPDAASGSPYAIFSVFDGHGGFAVSEWLKENLAVLIVEEWPQVDFCLEALSRACIRADNALVQPPQGFFGAFGRESRIRSTLRACSFEVLKHPLTRGDIRFRSHRHPSNHTCTDVVLMPV